MFYGCFRVWWYSEHVWLCPGMVVDRARTGCVQLRMALLGLQVYHHFPLVFRPYCSRKDNGKSQFSCKCLKHSLCLNWATCIYRSVYVSLKNRCFEQQIFLVIDTYNWATCKYAGLFSLKSGSSQQAVRTGHSAMLVLCHNMTLFKMT